MVLWDELILRPSSIGHPPMMCGSGGGGSGGSKHFQFLLPIHCLRTFSRFFSLSNRSPMLLFLISNVRICAIGSVNSPLLLLLSLFFFFPLFLFEIT